MKLSKTNKQDIARKAAIAISAKKRDTAYKVLQKELTQIAERQFIEVPLQEMTKYSDFIYFDNHLYGGKNFPDGFIDIERCKQRQYKDFGFIPSGEIELLKSFPCFAEKWEIIVSNEFAEEYVKAVRKYIFIYFEAQKNYKLILETLNTISTDKELTEEFPELVIFLTLSDDEKQQVSKEKMVKCKSLLKECRQLFIENISE